MGPLIITSLDDLQEHNNLRFFHMLPVAFAWQEKNSRADDGLGSGLEDGSFCAFVTVLWHNRFEQKNNRELEEIWIFNHSIIPPFFCKIPNFLGFNSI